MGVSTVQSHYLVIVIVRISSVYRPYIFRVLCVNDTTDITKKALRFNNNNPIAGGIYPELWIFRQISPTCPSSRTRRNR